MVATLLAERRRWPGPEGRATHPQDLHATLVFLGAVDAAQRACVEDAAGRVSAVPFALRLDRRGAWPGPRIRWCGQEPTPVALLDLVDQLTSHLAACGHEPERRPYRLHVTLERKAAPLPAAALPTPIHWPVDELVLAASQSRRRPAYRVLRRWPLRAAASPV